MKKRLIYFLIMTFILITNVYAEDSSKKETKAKENKSEKSAEKTKKKGEKNSKNTKSEDKKKEESEKDKEENFAELASGYREITLGMDFEAAKKALEQDSIFGYRGERDISLLAGENRTLIETQGSSNIKRAWFQFYENKLYIIIIQMDTDKIDYYSMYTALCKKYGEPESIDPKKSIWKSETVYMMLERPLLIKYIDMETFKTILEKHKDSKAYSDILREDFINGF